MKTNYYWLYALQQREMKNHLRPAHGGGVGDQRKESEGKPTRLSWNYKNEHHEIDILRVIRDGYNIVAVQIWYV